MYKGHKQVYASTKLQIAAAMKAANVSSLMIYRNEETIAFANRQSEQIFETVLGNSWNKAWIDPIRCEGNYMCVLRNNHVVHVQGILQNNVLVLATPMYSEPLELLTLDQRAPFPPIDEELPYVWSFTEGELSIAVRPAEENEEGNFTVTLVAGPHIHCRMPLIVPPNNINMHDLRWKAAADSLVNQLAMADNQIVFWKATSAPPHYTKHMIGTTK